MTHSTATQIERLSVWLLFKLALIMKGPDSNLIQKPSRFRTNFTFWYQLKCAYNECSICLYLYCMYYVVGKYIQCCQTHSQQAQRHRFWHLLMLLKMFCRTLTFNVFVKEYCFYLINANTKNENNQYKYENCWKKMYFV